MLTVESTADETLDCGEMRLALFAAKDALAAKILLVCHAHVEASSWGRCRLGVVKASSAACLGGGLALLHAMKLCQHQSWWTKAIGVDELVGVRRIFTRRLHAQG